MRYRAQGGFILAAVTIVILGLTFLGLALLYLSHAEGVVVVKEVWLVKAMSIAEAGLDRTLWKMDGVPGWTTGWTDVPLGDGAYSVTITPTGQPRTYRVSSTGTVGGVSKTVVLIVESGQVNNKWPAAFDYALFWGNSTGSGSQLSVRNSAWTKGSIFSYGNTYVEKNASVTDGDVYSTGTVTGPGTYTVGELPDPLPDRLTLDTSYYDGLIATAQSKPAGDWTLGNNKTYNLSGQTLYVRGNITINNNCTINGPGKLVATGNITAGNNTVIRSQVDLISGSRVLLNNNGIQVESTGGVIYGRQLISVSQNVSIELYHLLSPQSIELLNNATIHGVVWGNTVTLRNNAYVKGSIYGDSFTGNEIQNTFGLEYDPDIANWDPPPGVPAGPSEIVLEVKQWYEEEAEGV